MKGLGDEGHFEAVSARIHIGMVAYLQDSGVYGWLFGIQLFVLELIPGGGERASKPSTEW